MLTPSVERTIRRSIVAGKISAPPSIAIAHRAIVACSLAQGQSVLSNVPSSPEIGATIAACNSFGADIVTENGVADVFGAEEIMLPQKVECAGSNTTLKLMLPLASLFEPEVEFIGNERLAAKPLKAFVGYLERLGATCYTPSGFLPVRMRGPIKESQLVYLPKLGTQFLSGLLLCSPLRAIDTEIGIEGEFSGWEYVQQTIGLMEKCGISFSSKEKDYIYLQGGQPYVPLDDFEIPASPYLASFPILAGALAGRVQSQGVQGFEKLQTLLEAFGASATSGEGGFSSSVGPLSGIELSAAELGRLLPHAMVLASAASGDTKIKAIHSLSRHELTRMRSMMRCLGKMGVKFREDGADLIISGGKLNGAEIQPEGDATVAMACSIAALAANSPTKIIGAECVSKSYPDFFKDLSQLGAIIR